MIERKLAMNSLDFECGSCEITWSKFHQNNIPCIILVLEKEYMISI